MFTIRPILASLLLFGATDSHASDALIYAAAYECHAADINRDLTEACAQAYPELTARAQAAFGAWDSRNTPKARLAGEACQAGLATLMKSMPQSEIDAARQDMINTLAAIRNGVRARIREDGKPFCTESFDKLERGGGTMDFK